MSAQESPQPSDATTQGSIFPDDFEWPDTEDCELECVIDLLRAESVKAMMWGQERDMQLLDGIIERLERHEHRR